jgi:hypothetical protein
MTVKLAILKSGENIISDIKEGFFEEKLVCYLLEKPCSIVINGSYRVVGEEEDEEETKNRVSISLKTWPSLSDQTVVEIVPDWIVTLVEPNEQLKKMYEEQVLGTEQNEINENVGITERSDSDQSD